MDYEYLKVPSKDDRCCMLSSCSSQRTSAEEGSLLTTVVYKSRNLIEGDTSMEEKKVWEAPTVVVYGDLNSMTQTDKLKQPGSLDDFGVAGISDA